MLLVFDKSYHDSTNNEKISQSIKVFIVYLLPKNFKHGIGLSLRILYYGFIKVPYYMFICKIDNVRFTYYIHVYLFLDLIIASFGPLVTILNQNKLTRSNYVD